MPTKLRVGLLKAVSKKNKSQNAEEEFIPVLCSLTVFDTTELSIIADLKQAMFIAYKCHISLRSTL